MRQHLVKTFRLGLAAGLAATLVAAPLRAANAPEDPTVSAPPIAGWWDLDEQTTGLTGNRYEAGRYVRPQSTPRFGITALRLRDGAGFDSLDVWGRDLLSDNQNLMVQAWSRNVPARLRFKYDRAVFYEDATLGAASLAAASHMSTDAVVRPATWAELRGAFKEENNNLGPLARGDTINNQVQEASAGLDVNTGLGTIGGSLSNLAYRDRVVGEPSRYTQQFGASYDALLGTRWTLAASAKFARIHQTGLAVSSLTIMGVNGGYQPSKNLWFDARYAYRKSNLGPTLDAYVAKSAGGGASMTWRATRPLTLRTGIDRTEYQRFDSTQTTVEKPHQTQLYVRGDYRSGGTRARLSYAFSQLSSGSQATEPDLFNNSPLFYDSEHKLNAHATRMVGKGGLAYGYYEWDEKRNRYRSYCLDTQNLGGGITLPMGPRATMAADVMYRNCSSKIQVMSGMAADSLVAHVGVAFEPAKHWRLTTDYHRVETYFGQKADDDMVSAGLTWDPGHGHIWTLTFNRDAYDGGTLPGLAYGADIVKLTYSGGF